MVLDKDLDKDIKQEYDFYLSQPEEWKKENYGKTVLIKDQKIHGIYASHEDAFQEGIKKFGDSKFLIHEIGSEDVLNYNTFSLTGAT